MSKPIKNLIANAVRSRYAGLESALWVEMIGADGASTNQFRRELRSRNMRLELVKTSLFRRAMSDSKLKPLAEAASGPVALLTGGSSVIDIAKLVEEWAPKVKGLRMRAAVLEGEFIAESQIDQLAKMPTRQDMLGRIAGCVLSPGAKLASAIRAPGANIAGCLKALIEKLEKGEAAAPAA